MEPGVPLVVSQVNPGDAALHEGIIANPNCSTMQLVPVLMALRDAVGLERVVVDTYQTVSGTGHKAVAELEDQIRAHVGGRPKEAQVYPHPIAFNALPEIDVFLDNGYTKEEWKVVTESRKILHLPDLRMSCTAVRIPVFYSHSEAVHVETREPITPGARPGALRRGPRRGRPGRSGERTSIRSRRTPPVATRSSSGGCGRIRRSRMDRGLAFWVVSDNIRKGAATNAVEIAELLVANDWLAKASAARDARVGRGRRRRARVTDAERQAALEQIADEVRVCTRCRLHQQRTRSVPGEGNPDTEVVFVGEGPGFNEDREGRPFVGRAGGAAREAARVGRLAPRGCLHHERRQVPTAGQPRSGARRDRGLRAVPATAAGGRSTRRSSSRSAASRWARSCPARGSARRTGRCGRWTRRRARVTPWRSRCTTRPRHFARPRSRRRASGTWPAFRVALLKSRERRDEHAARHRGCRGRRRSPRIRHRTGLTQAATVAGRRRRDVGRSWNRRRFVGPRAAGAPGGG